jgi:hypothetical protein
VRWLIVLALISCGKKAEGPTCEQVTDHILEVTKQQLPGHENTNLGIQKKAMVEQCEKKNMPTEVRTCLLGAKTISEIATCRGRGKSNVLEKPRRPRPPAIGSAGSAAGSGTGSAAPTTGSAGSAGGSGTGSGSAR